MNFLSRTVLCLALLSGFSGACGDDGEDDGAANGGANAEALSAPAGFKVSTVDGKPHLTWTDSSGEDHYMIERMDHSASSDWAVVKDADNLVPGSNQFHDGSAKAGTTYMYRVVAMKGETRAVSPELTWPSS